MATEGQELIAVMNKAIQNIKKQREVSRLTHNEIVDDSEETVEDTIRQAETALSNQSAESGLFGNRETNS